MRARPPPVARVWPPSSYKEYDPEVEKSLTDWEDRVIPTKNDLEDELETLKQKELKTEPAQKVGTKSIEKPQPKSLLQEVAEQSVNLLKKSTSKTVDPPSEPVLDNGLRRSTGPRKLTAKYKND